MITVRSLVQVQHGPNFSYRLLIKKKSYSSCQCSCSEGTRGFMLIGALGLPKSPFCYAIVANCCQLFVRINCLLRTIAFFPKGGMANWFKCFLRKHRTLSRPSCRYSSAPKGCPTLVPKVLSLILNKQLIRTNKRDERGSSVSYGNTWNQEGCAATPEGADELFSLRSREAGSLREKWRSNNWHPKQLNRQLIRTIKQALIS